MTTAVSDGTRSLFASSREVPYYRLGQRMNTRDTEQAMKDAGIADVRYDLSPAVLPDGASKFLTPTNHVTWTNPFTGEVEVIGTVGDRYRIIQPRDALAVFKGLNHPWDTLGLIDKGRGIFGTIEWEREISLDPNGADEKIKSWLTVRSGFDGSMGLTGGRSSMRFICFNMFRTMFKGLSDKFTIRHTASAEAKIAQVNAELRKTDTYFDLQEKVVTAAFQTPLPEVKFWDVVQGFYPKPEENKKGAETKWENRIGLISQAWKGEPNAAIRGTVYGGWQAMLEADQWGRNIQRGRDTVSPITGMSEGEENFFSAGAGLDAATDARRQAIFEAFYSLVPNQPVKV